MTNHDDKDRIIESLIKEIRRLGKIIALLMVTIIIVSIVAILRPDLSSWFKKSEKELAAEKQQKQDYQNWQDEVELKKEETTYWHPANIGSIPSYNISLISKVKYGEELIVHTAKYLGPKGSVAQITNGMNCQNCHLEAGTKIWGNNYGAVFATYPKYRPRSGTIEDLYKRINDCMERSLNGQALAVESKEMQSIKSYIEFIGKNAPKGEKPKGSGIVELPFLNRPADPIQGKVLFITKCQSCHMADGQGQLAADGIEYTYPPLWGKNSYNVGAGLYRMSRFAGFIKYNMPQPANYQKPMLTDEEAWDIAAFVNSQSRPTKDLSKDWPKIDEKPVDHPFGPYVDGFSEEQHKFGPFNPIADLKKKNQKK